MFLVNFIGSRGVRGAVHDYEHSKNCLVEEQHKYKNEVRELYMIMSSVNSLVGERQKYKNGKLEQPWLLHKCTSYPVF